MYILVIIAAMYIVHFRENIKWSNILCKSRNIYDFYLKELEKNAVHLDSSYFFT